jgi:NAD-dependent dihydropyrimidine dehydrogenase PreA subunit
MKVAKRIVLHFPRRVVDRPIVSRLVRDFNLDFNILKASVSPEAEGLLVLELSGEREDYDRGVEYLTETGVKIQSLTRDVTRNEDRCTSCGACLTVCPTGCFTVNTKTRKVTFQGEKCVACGICLKACPPRAMEVHF